MALTDARRPTKESLAWTAWPWSRGTAAPSPVTYDLAPTSGTFPSTASTSPGSVSSYSVFGGSTTGYTSTTYASPSATSSTSSLLSSTVGAGITTPSTPARSGSFAFSGHTSTPVTLVDQLSLTSLDDGADHFSTFNSTPPAPDNLTQSLLANYSAVAADFAGDISNGSSLASTLELPRGGGGGGGSGGGLSLSLPDLLEEDELMALWNCTNCFLLNYGTAAAGNHSARYYNTTNGTADPRDVLLLTTDDDDAFASETTIYLIRVIATAIVLGIVILATVIGK
ncbi:hypothetical protein ZHAS_00015466 [Anopheles sinensis]|uniref:Uncharacterized protein n=1 Tax=Anopheles sinensis TaxID=74873 RepID=A0A084WBB6_ANOSI|nr:hypothetical protein ZHAS_00015466 [Anopheles sinensis]